MRGTVAPNHAVITLSEIDAERFETFADALVRELEDAIREHARDRSYRFIGPVKVELYQDPDFKKGEYTLVVEVRQGPGGMPAAALVLGDGSRIAVGEDPVIIGRAPECDIELADATVSRRHAEIVRDGDAWFIRDLGSSNGTKVNGAGVVDQMLQRRRRHQARLRHLHVRDVVAGTTRPCPTASSPFCGSLLLSLIWLFFLRVLGLLAAKPRPRRGGRRRHRRRGRSGRTPPRGDASRASKASLARRQRRRRSANKEFTVGERSHRSAAARAARCSWPIRWSANCTPACSATPRALHIEDLGSTNGTYLNGRKVGGPARLKKGDRIRVGPIELEVLG